jgi:hypothetical protein
MEDDLELDYDEETAFLGGDDPYLDGSLSLDQENVLLASPKMMSTSDVEPEGVVKHPVNTVQLAPPPDGYRIPKRNSNQISDLREKLMPLTQNGVLTESNTEKMPKGRLPSVGQQTATGANAIPIRNDQLKAFGSQNTTPLSPASSPPHFTPLPISLTSNGAIRFPSPKSPTSLPFLAPTISSIQWKQNSTPSTVPIVPLLSRPIPLSAIPLSSVFTGGVTRLSPPIPRPQPIPLSSLLNTPQHTFLLLSAKTVLIGQGIPNRLQKALNSRVQVQRGTLSDLVHEWANVNSSQDPVHVVVQGGEEVEGGVNGLREIIGQLCHLMSTTWPNASILFLLPFFPDPLQTDINHRIDQIFDHVDRLPRVQGVKTGKFLSLVGLHEREGQEGDGGPTPDGIRRLARWIDECIKEVDSAVAMRGNRRVVLVE